MAMANENNERLPGVDVAEQITQRLLIGASGVLPRQHVRSLIQQRRMVWCQNLELDESQFQPSSLDLRIGRRGWRVRASFLPGRGKTVQQQIETLKSDEINLENGAVLERDCVYIVEILERVNLPESVAVSANPKSSTGRLDIFTRLIADHSEIFDAVPGGYEGPLYMEISPRSFSVRIKTGSKLNQIRFRRRNSQQSSYAEFRLTDNDIIERHRKTPLVDNNFQVRNGLVMRVDLTAELANGDQISDRRDSPRCDNRQAGRKNVGTSRRNTGNPAPADCVHRAHRREIHSD